jgi:hypothetical protein
LEAAIQDFLDQHNANAKAFKWIKSADGISPRQNDTAYFAIR